MPPQRKQCRKRKVKLLSKRIPRRVKSKAARLGRAPFIRILRYFFLLDESVD